jgi:hypothetical protein
MPANSFDPETPFPGMFPQRNRQMRFADSLHFQWLIAIKNAGKFF